MPNSVVKLGYYVFNGCENLKKIKISASAIEIDDKICPNCNNLSQIIVDNSNPKFDSRDNFNALIRTEDNELIVGCSETIIPDTVVSIGEKAFEDRLGLKKLKIPASVKK